MKRTSRLTAMLLAVAMVFALAGCQKKEPPPGPDAMAQVLFDSMLKNDASSAVELLGYPSEEAARKDMGLDGDIYEEAAEQIVSQLEQMGLQVGEDKVQEFIDAFLTMFSKIDMTTTVKEMDKKEGTAVVTCSITTIDSAAMNTTMEEAMLEAMSDPDLVNSGDTAAIGEKIVEVMIEVVSGLEPTSETKDFDVNFKLGVLEINGKDREAWLPADAEAFGMAISNAAMGG